MADSLDLVDQDYVIVSGPLMDVSSTSASVSKPNRMAHKSDSEVSTSSIPMPIIGTINSSTCDIGSLESQSSAPGFSPGSMDMGDALEQPSTHCITRIKSLQQCASAITELVHEKVGTVSAKKTSFVFC